MPVPVENNPYPGKWDLSTCTPVIILCILPRKRTILHPIPSSVPEGSLQAHQYADSHLHDQNHFEWNIQQTTTQPKIPLSFSVLRGPKKRSILHFGMQGCHVSATTQRPSQCQLACCLYARCNASEWNMKQNSILCIHGYPPP